MSRSRKKIVSVVLNYHGDETLEKKILYEEPFVDHFLIFDLVEGDSEYLVDMKKNNITRFQINLTEGSSPRNQFRNIIELIRNKILNIEFDIEDIFIIGESNFFFDIENFDFSEIVINPIFYVNHKKVHWNINWTDNKFMKGSIVTTFSFITFEEFSTQVFNLYQNKDYDWEFKKILNGYVLLGYGTNEQIIKKNNFTFNEVIIDVDDDLLNFLKRNSLPIDKYDPRRIDILKTCEIDSKFNTIFNINSDLLRSEKKILINLSSEPLNCAGYDEYINLKKTDVLRNHLKLDNCNLFVFIPDEKLYDSMENDYFLNESKKAIKLFNPIDNDKIFIEDEDNIFEFFWFEIKDKNVADLIKNKKPLDTEG